MTMRSLVVMSPVKTPEDLDAVKIEFPMPLPLLGAIGNHMVKAGMEATVTAYYRQACTEGWAPAPTNEVQKAIWDKAHAVPAKPMKIEFDPKTGK